MTAPKTLLLSHSEILRKLERMACEIAERHVHSPHLVICGLNERGKYIAQKLGEYLQPLLPQLKISHLRAGFDGQEKNGNSLYFEGEAPIEQQPILVVDDVIHSGKTALWVVQALFSKNPLSIETAFLAKREHGKYPIASDIVGISIATTLQEHVYFDNTDPQNLKVYLA